MTTSIRTYYELNYGGYRIIGDRGESATVYDAEQHTPRYGGLLDVIMMHSYEQRIDFDDLFSRDAEEREDCGTPYFDYPWNSRGKIPTTVKPRIVDFMRQDQVWHQSESPTALTAFNVLLQLEDRNRPHRRRVLGVIRRPDPATCEKGDYFRDGDCVNIDPTHERVLLGPNLYQVCVNSHALAPRVDYALHYIGPYKPFTSTAVIEGILAGRELENHSMLGHQSMIGEVVR